MDSSDTLRILECYINGNWFEIAWKDLELNDIVRLYESDRAPVDGVWLVERITEDGFDGTEVFF